MDSFTSHILEIHELIATYLHSKDICACLAVCRQWNGFYASALWRNLSDPSCKQDQHDDHRRLTHDPLEDVPHALIAKNAHHIRELRVAKIPYADALLSTCHQLRRMIVYSHSEHTNELIKHNKLLETLVIHRALGNTWLSVGPKSHVFLRHLTLVRTTLYLDCQWQLWDLAEQLETLEMEWVIFANTRALWETGSCPPIGPPSPRTLCRLRKLVVRATTFIPDEPFLTFFDLGHTYPALEHLEYTPVEIVTYDFLSTDTSPYQGHQGHEIAKAIQERFASVKSLVLNRDSELQEQDLSTIVYNAPTLERFCGQQFLSLGQMTLDALVARHANNLTHVDLRQTRHAVEFKPVRRRVCLSSEQVLLIPKTCPKLVEFQGPTVSANALVKSAPWACTSHLRVLVLGICIHDKSHKDANKVDAGLYWSAHAWFPRQFDQIRKDTKLRLKIQDSPSRKYLQVNRQVFDMLSRLTLLETLDISLPYGVWFPPAGELSLSFEGGLGKLGRLRRLRTFGFFKYAERKMPRHYEYRWMTQRWPMLQKLRLEERAVFQFEFPIVFVKDWIPTVRMMHGSVETDHSQRLPFELSKWTDGFPLSSFVEPQA